MPDKRSWVRRHDNLDIVRGTAHAQGMMRYLLPMLLLCSCLPDVTASPDAAVSARVVPLPRTLMLSASSGIGGTYNVATGLRSVQPHEAVVFGLPLHEQDVVLSLQIRAWTQPGTHTLLVVAQEEGVRGTIAEPSFHADEPGWGRYTFPLPTPHRLVDETAYSISWESTAAAEVEQLQVVYLPVTPEQM